MQQDLITKYHEVDNTLAQSGGSILGSLLTMKYFDTARELVENGFTFGPNDRGLLWLCAMMNNLDGARFLLDSGFDPNDTNTAGQSALHICTTGDMVHLLVRAGADLDVTDRDGNTALHLAYQRDKAEALIARGASVTTKNRDGHTAERFLWLWAKTQKAGDGYEVIAKATRIRQTRDELMNAVASSHNARPTQQRRAL